MSTDSDIIRRAANDPNAFVELFDRHARAIAGFAIRRVGVDAADDVVSETFLVAYRKRSKFDPEATSALPWLFGIASREVHKHRTAEQRQWRVLEAGIDTPLDDAVDSSDDRIDAQRNAFALAPQLAKLARRDRDTLLLYAWGDLTYEQVAAAQNIPVGTVRSRLNRVRRQISIARPDLAARAARTGGESA